MNLPVNNGTIFSNFFTDQNVKPILNKNELRPCDVMRDYFISQLTKESRNHVVFSSRDRT